MRTNDILLDGFNDIRTLQRYLYLPDACFSESMTNKTMLGIIDQLKENPATEYPNSFKNRWDEIVSITSANVAQNEYKWANGRYRGSV